MIKDLNINIVQPHPDNPRKNLGDLTELVGSIKTFGVLQNLTVVPKEDGEYYVVCGHRRLAAAKEAGLENLPCTVAEAMDRKTQISIMLLENMQRSDLTAQEEAQGFQMMLDLGSSIADIVKDTGMSETKVRHRVKLNELDQDLLGEKMGDNISINDLIKLEKIKDPEKRNQALEHIGTNNFEWELKRIIAIEKRERVEEILKETIPEYRDDLFAWQHEHVGEVSIDAADEEIKEFAVMLKEKSEEEGRDIGISFGSTTVSGLLVREAGTREVDDPEAEAERKAQAERKAKLQSQYTRCQEMWGDEIRGMTEGKARTNSENIAKHMVKGLLRWDIDEDDFLSLMGEEALPDEYEDELAIEIIDEVIEREPYRSLAVATFLNLSPGKYTGPWDYEGTYDERRVPRSFLGFMGEIGYSMSDDEKAMWNGKSELYQRETTEK